MTNDIIGTDEDLNPWMADIRLRFPDWNTDESLKRWPGDKNKLRIGQKIDGDVVALAPFGVWLDIGVSFPALLLVPRMTDTQDPQNGQISFPSIGKNVDGRICALGAGEIGITQLNPDQMIDGSTDRY